MLCSITERASTASLPRGWREGFRRLGKFLGCGAEPAGSPPKMRSEDYLKSLEHPGAFFRVDIEKQAGEKVGFDAVRKSDYVEVDKLLQSGAIPRWNEASPARAVFMEDRIISVNGVQGNGTLMADELRSASMLSLRIFRVSSQDRRGIELRRSEEKVKKLLREAPPAGLGDGLPEPAGSKVAVLHAKNIDKFVAAQPVALIMFYANWCGHCQQLAPEFSKAAHIISEMQLPKSVRLAKFDDGDSANKYYAAGRPDKFNFTSYPSFAYCTNGKHEGFYGADGAQEIAAQVAARVKGLDVESEVREVIFKARPMLYRPDVDGETVLDLEPETFDDIVLKNYAENNRVWIIEFYSDKCPFCKSLKPEIIKASQTLKEKLGSRVKLAGVNSRAFHMLAERFGVTSYPWIIAIYAGRKLEDMAGLGGAQSVIDWATAKFKASWRAEPTWSDATPEWPAAKGAQKEELLPDDKSGSWKELLGRRTWFFLHTLAAKYPEEPSAADEAAVKHLVATLGQHYPCPICRKHLQEKLVNSDLGPPPTKKRQDLTKWFCRLHNMVNADLNKTHFGCNAFELDLKYLKSCGECSAAGPVEVDEGAVKWDFFAYLKKAGSGSTAAQSRAAGEL